MVRVARTLIAPNGIIDFAPVDHAHEEFTLPGGGEAEKFLDFFGTRPGEIQRQQGAGVENDAFHRKKWRVPSDEWREKGGKGLQDDRNTPRRKVGVWGSRGEEKADPSPPFPQKTRDWARDDRVWLAKDATAFGMTKKVTACARGGVLREGFR